MKSALHPLLLLVSALALPIIPAHAAAPFAAFSLDTNRAVLDLRKASWEYVHDPDGKSSPDQITARSNWAPIRVGRSWENGGGTEALRKGAVWVRTRVAIPAQARGRSIAFLCTAMGGNGDLFLNGKPVGSHVEYDWGKDVPGPFSIELGAELKYGEVNELLVRCDPKGAIRSIGLIGLVCLRQSVPFNRNPDGAIAVSDSTSNSYRVFLHYGDALLAKGEQTQFTAAELEALNIPPYGLREDEMICVVPADASNIDQLRRVNVALLHHTTDQRPISVRCAGLPANVNQFDLLQIPLDVAGTYRNPFEPREIDVTAIIRTPSGKTETIHAFFSQDYEPVKVGEFEEILLPLRGPGTPWRVNYRPRETGRYLVRIVATDRTGVAQFEAGGFEVSSKAARGFLRISKNDPRFFEFDSGESFYGTGPSGWFRQTENWIFGGNTRWVPIETQKKYYERKGENRSSYEYLARWHFGQLYLKGGFIDAYVAWKLDQAVRAMEVNGIYWITYGRPGAGRTYSNGARPNIMGSQTQIIRQAGLPSLQELGFPTAGRIELSHFVSRFADSPAIWIWNCAEEDNVYNADVLPYHDYIRSLDVYRHPHGISEGPISVQHGSDVALLPDWYGWSFEKCLTNYTALTQLPHAVIDVEGGAVNSARDLTGIVERLDRIATGYHNHLWLCLFMKMAAGGTDWFNNELDAGQRLFHAKAISQFLDAEHLTKIRWDIAAAETTETPLKAFALRSPRKTLAWIVRPPGSPAPNAGNAGATVKIPIAADGRYTVEFWDTREGKIVATQTVESAKGFATVELPPIASDLALKVLSSSR